MAYAVEFLLKMIYNGWKEKWQEDAMEKDLRRLVIKAFHVRDVSYG